LSRRSKWLRSVTSEIQTKKKGGGMRTDSKRQEDETSKVVNRLREIGVVRGVILQMAKRGQILEVRCEMPECYYPKGRKVFDKKSSTGPSEWILTSDHYPRLKSDGGTLAPGNVRLSHRLCNRVNYGWRTRITPMLDEGMSLHHIADELNQRKIQAPHGTNRWSAATVRKAFVS
jgi:hypothetical protein